MTRVIRSTRDQAMPRRAVVGALGIVLGLAVGFGSGLVGPVPLLAASLAAGASVAIIARPEVGALAVVCLTLVVPRELLFDRGIPLGGGSLKITDVLVLLSVGGWFAHWAVSPSRRAVPAPSRSIVVMVVVVMGLAIAAVGTNASRGGSVQDALTDLRPFTALLLVFPLAAFVRRQRDLAMALRVTLLACAVGAGWIIVLYLAGNASAATYAEGALRVTDVTFVAPLLGTVWALVLLPYTKGALQLTVLALAALSLAALFFTLQRSAWITLILAVGFASLLMTPRRRTRMIGGLVVLCALAAVMIVAVNAASSVRVENPLASGLARIQSVDAYGEDVSALHREAEFHEAMKQVRAHPFAGIGLGGMLQFYSPLYNPSTSRPGIEVVTGYVHNSYTWLAVKMGLPGLLAFIALLGALLIQAIRLALREAPEIVRVGGLGCAATLVSLMIVSFAGPHLTSNQSLPYIALVIAAVDVLGRIRAAQLRPAGSPPWQGSRSG
jgi:O-antigen ligase